MPTGFREFSGWFGPLPPPLPPFSLARAHAPGTLPLLSGPAPAAAPALPLPRPPGKAKEKEKEKERERELERERERERERAERERERAEREAGGGPPPGEEDREGEPPPVPIQHPRLIREAVQRNFRTSYYVCGLAGFGPDLAILRWGRLGLTGHGACRGPGWLGPGCWQGVRGWVLVGSRASGCGLWVVSWLVGWLAGSTDG
jgi:hypothetical protein